ncbi:tripartite tricarboxylate transporter substrate binding protein [Ramlibacter sp. MAHUQ-53]|uniref:tripartite tricarboxylate transporter substrate binding protein n=1 Tax=unclassified Ramlibacter TaxID=2617605 RepID=UPI003627DC34
MKIARTLKLAALSLALGLTALAPAQAQDKVTRLVVPFSAGGGVDALARLLARKLQADLGETVLVENKPGAGGNLGLDFVAAAAPDGRTLAIITNSLVINPILTPGTKYDPHKSFAPVSMLAYSPVVLVAKNDLPVNTLPELLKYAKSRPGKLAYGSCGNGGIHHLAAEMMKAMANVHIVHVPYKGCSGASTDVAGGQIDLAMMSVNSVAGFIDSKRVKALGVTSEKPSTLLPAVPTIASAGLKGYGLEGWYAAFAPAGTPPPVVERLNAAFARALNDPEVRKALTTGYFEPQASTPAALGEFIARETANYRKLVTAQGIKGD